MRPLQGRDRVVDPMPRVALCGYAASLTLGFGVRRFQRQEGGTSQGLHLVSKLRLGDAYPRSSASTGGEIAATTGTRWSVRNNMRQQRA